jgi:hypothetical protein
MTGEEKTSNQRSDFKPTLVKWDKEGHFTLIKWAIHQKEITIINLYEPNISTPNCLKHTLKFRPKKTYRVQQSDSGRL